MSAGASHRSLDMSRARPTYSAFATGGAVAQLGERDVRNVEVRGSIPRRSTTHAIDMSVFFVRALSLLQTGDHTFGLHGLNRPVP